MKCAIPGQNIKVFGRGLHSLAKIGEDLYLEPQKDGLALRTMNSSRSAFASYLFEPVFFSVYDIGRGEDARCKITMKSAVWVFKSIASLEKTVTTAYIEISPKDYKIKIKFQCKFGVLKTFTINFLECDSLKANYDSATSSNHFTASARVLNEAALNFLVNQEEVTMIASPSSFLMKNYIDTVELESKAVHTALTMQPAEFEVYCIGKASSVTYCLKELRSIIGFADAFSLSLSVDFDVGGIPIVFSLKWPQTCQAALVMATLADEGEEDEQASTQTQTVAAGPNRIRMNRDEASLPLTMDPRISTQKIGGRKIPEMHPSLTPIQRMEEEEDHPDVVNSSHVIGGNGDGRHTPPSKRAKFYFKKCFDETFNPQRVEGAQKILAPDSDEEES